MARIRSVHPSLWTDEAFVSLSIPARLFFIGLWNEADDQGAFEWKPLTLKMRVLPADNVDVAELLSELEEGGRVTRYEVDGKSYGLVRNFTKFQRPKKPNSVHPLPDGAVTGSEPIPHQAETPSEKSPQMEEEGGRVEEEKEEPPVASQPPPLPAPNSDDRKVDAEPDLDVPANLRRGPKDHADVQSAFEAYNAVAGRCGLPAAQKLTDARRRKLVRRLHDCGGLDGWHVALDKLEASKGLRGDNDRGWRADLDFLCQDQSFTRLMEGFYDGWSGSKPAAGSVPDDYRAGIVAGLGIDDGGYPAERGGREPVECQGGAGGYASAGDGSGVRGLH